MQDATVLYENIIDMYWGWLQYTQVSWKKTHSKEKKSRDYAVHFSTEIQIETYLITFS